MTKFNLKGFMECEHEFRFKPTTFGFDYVKGKDICVKCGMDKRMEEPVKQLIEVENDRRKRKGTSSEE